MGVPFVVLGQPGAAEGSVSEPRVLSGASLYDVMSTAGLVFTDNGTFSHRDSIAEKISSSVGAGVAGEVMDFLTMPFSDAEDEACKMWLEAVDSERPGPGEGPPAGRMRFGVMYHNNGIFVAGCFRPGTSADPLIVRVALYKPAAGDGSGEGAFELLRRFYASRPSGGGG
jgi:hypothetical protein